MNQVQVSSKLQMRKPKLIVLSYLTNLDTTWKQQSPDGDTSPPTTRPPTRHGTSKWHIAYSGPGRRANEGLFQLVPLAASLLYKHEPFSESGVRIILRII